MTGKALMLQGTGSDVGKSVLTAGLCRAFVRRGMTVRPFKPQNMSNNAAVAEDAEDGAGEIGRAQWLQALACGVAPSVHMNPVLLKPNSDTGSQVVLRGRALEVAEARQYWGTRGSLLAPVIESFEHLKAQADIVVVEGAGSAAEANLRRGDIANMGFAVPTRTPVVLVGDINRGGVIAALVGTQAVLDAADRETVAGFIVNLFRGDPRLFDDGLAMIVERTGWRSFGVVPFLPQIKALPAEDAVVLEQGRAGRTDAPSSPCRWSPASPISTISTRCAPIRPSTYASVRRARPCRATRRLWCCRGPSRPCPISVS